MTIIICRADEVLDIIGQRPIVAVLSIEYPGVQPGVNGYAPRLAEHGHGHIPQKIATFWDTEDRTIARSPDLQSVEESMSFIVAHAARGDMIVHCHAGVARSTGAVLGALALLHPDRDAKDLAEDLLRLRPVAAPNILVVEHADKIAGRNGTLLQAVLDHPVLTRQRADVEKRRALWMERNPEMASVYWPEKMPKP